MDAAGWILAGLAGMLGVQRLLELRLSARHERALRARGAVEHGRSHYPLFFLLHGAWLLGFVAEAWWRGPVLSSRWPLWAGALVLAEALRYWAIGSLGERWSTRILVLPGADRIRRGPYRWLRHPNYVAVAIELAAVPMLVGAPVTAVAAGLANALLLLGVRIPAEARALASPVPGRPAGT
jgi:methyltransferase